MDNVPVYDTSGGSCIRIKKHWNMIFRRDYGGSVVGGTVASVIYTDRSFSVIYEVVRDVGLAGRACMRLEELD